MITILCGVPGKGKTALATQLGLKAVSSGCTLFSNYSISFKVLGLPLTSNNYELEWFKQKRFPENSFIIIDEGQNVFNSRFFKNMDIEEIKYFSGHRHLGNEIVITTQHPNRIDITLREFSDRFIFIRYALPFGFKICYEYPIADYVGKVPPEVPKPFFKIRIYKVHKSTYTKYDDKYLKSVLLKDIASVFPVHDYKRSKYIPYPVRLYKAVKMKVGFYKMVWDMRKELKVNKKLNSDIKLDGRHETVGRLREIGHRKVSGIRCSYPYKRTRIVSRKRNNLLEDAT